jgi:site-specific DNA recombinase
MHMNETTAPPIAPEHQDTPLCRVATYCRVSTLQEEQELSYETQLDYYTRLVSADPTMTLVGVYGDQGGSGLMIKCRPEFQRMMSDCMNGKVDVIMTKSISRFARNLADCVHCVRLLREKGIPVIFEKEGINSADPSSEMLLSILASLAQEEVRGLSDNLRWSLEQRNASGNPTRYARYGYRKAKDEQGKVVWRIYEPEAAQVRLAFQMAAQGEAYRDILIAMNKREAEASASAGTDQPVIWTQTRLYALLKSETYMGDVLTNKTYTADYLNKRVARNYGEKPQYYIERHHEPIIDRDTFHLVGDLIRQRKLHGIKGERQRWRQCAASGIADTAQ